MAYCGMIKGKQNRPNFLECIGASIFAAIGPSLRPILGLRPFYIIFLLYSVVIRSWPLHRVSAVLLLIKTTSIKYTPTCIINALIFYVPRFIQFFLVDFRPKRGEPGWKLAPNMLYGLLHPLESFVTSCIICRWSGLLESHTWSSFT